MFWRRGLGDVLGMGLGVFEEGFCVGIFELEDVVGGGTTQWFGCLFTKNPL